LMGTVTQTLLLQTRGVRILFTLINQPKIEIN